MAYRQTDQFQDQWFQKPICKYCAQRESSCRQHRVVPPVKSNQPIALHTLPKKGSEFLTILTLTIRMETKI